MSVRRGREGRRQSGKARTHHGCEWMRKTSEERSVRKRQRRTTVGLVRQVVYPWPDPAARGGRVYTLELALRALTARMGQHGTIHLE